MTPYLKETYQEIIIFFLMTGELCPSSVINDWEEYVCFFQLYKKEINLISDFKFCFKFFSLINMKSFLVSDIMDTNLYTFPPKTASS